MFSKACEYGIRAILHIAQQSINGNRVNLKAIAAEIDAPEAFTAKILQQLVKAEIIQSIRGPYGGFAIHKADMPSIKLSAIVNAIDGDSIYRGCGLGLKHCDADNPCPLHDRFAKIRDDLQQMLEQSSILELAEGLDIGLTFLKR